MPIVRPLILGLSIAFATQAAALAAPAAQTAESARKPVSPQSSGTFPLAPGLGPASQGAESADGKPTPMALDPADADPGKSACADFPAHANGRWQKTHPIPSDWSAWGTWTELEARQLAQLRSLIEGAADQADDDPEAARIADFYAAAMDVERVDRLGVEPIWPYLQEIDTLASPAEVMAYLAREHRGGRAPLFAIEVRTPAKGEGEAILALRPVALGLPEAQSYSATSPAAKGLLSDYEAHVSRSLQLARISKIGAQTAAESVRAIETRLAAALLARSPAAATAVERIEPSALAERYPNSDWPGYLAALELPANVQLELVDPAYFAEIDRLLGDTALEVWRDYLRWSLVRAMAPYLSVGFTDAEFLLYQSRLGGRQGPAPRWRTMVQLTAWAFPDWLGQRYAERLEVDDEIDTARRIADALRTRFRERLDKASWLSDDSRRKTREALDTLEIVIGPAQAWPASNTVAIAADDLVGNIRRTREEQMQRELARLRADPPESASASPPFALAIRYQPEAHRLSVPLALLQAPVLDADAPEPLNVGAFGALLGAAIHQAVEERAAERWTAKERRHRQSQLDAMGAAYAAFRIEGAQVDAARAAPLALADLAGLSLALDVLAASGASEKAQADVFRAWARLWRGQQRLQAIRMDLLAGALPWRLRASGPLAHLPEFQKAFACKAPEAQSEPAPQPLRPW